jgi:hypothetical protein
MVTLRPLSPAARRVRFDTHVLGGEAANVSGRALVGDVDDGALQDHDPVGILRVDDRDGHLG